MAVSVDLEGGGLFRSGSAWSAGDDGNFPGSLGRSSTAREDEEALKWAALEKLPTYDRLRKTILRDVADDSGNVLFRDVDVTTIRSNTRRRFIDRVLAVADVDNEKFIAKLKQRLDRVGIDMPKIEVRFEHLNVDADAFVGKRALPTAINATVNTVEGILNSLRILRAKRRTLTILTDVSGILKPGRLTLLLGPPGSGKSTLLKILSGKPDPNLRVGGTVTYNGHTFDEFVPQRTSAYISQYDMHFAEMTVRETLDFSARCQGVSYRYELLQELARREKQAGIKPDPDVDVFMKETSIEGRETNLVTDYVLKLLGLDICADTIVGDQMHRGISGGQKKRVTTGEMLVARPKALFMDEISTGLDSATTFQITKCLRQLAHVSEGTMLISLLQPAPETYNLFDDIILLSDGMMIYQGPREEVLGFFETMGFKCPERKGVADFLQEVTSRKDQEQYWADKSQPYRFVPVKEFADAFLSYRVGRQVLEDLSHPYDRTKCHPAALTTSTYGVSKINIFNACCSREWLLMKRNSFVYVFKTCQVLVVAIVTMTMFFRTKMHEKTVTDGNIYMGALFFALVHMMFNGLPELSMTVTRLPVFYKQRDLLFYPAWAYALPNWVVRIPFSLVEAGIWVGVTYYVIGFAPQAGRFFRQFLLLFMLHQMSLGLFKFIAALGRTMIISQTFGSAALLIVFVLGGFIISKDKIPHWWIWAYWVSPLSYGQNAIAVNEFLDHRWDKPAPNEPGKTLGRAVLDNRSMIAKGKMYWIGFAALTGFCVLFNILCIFVMQYLDPLGKQAVITEDQLEEQEVSRVGESKRRDSTASRREGRASFEMASRMSGAERRESAGSQDAGPSSNANARRGMILPFQPLAMAFDKVNYYVDMPSEMRMQGVEESRLRLLTDVSGSFRPGVLTALMGVSGAGKTTLMDVLAGRKTGGYIEGSISISGFPKNQETFARVSGYCEQNDIHSPFVTVYESLVYSAWLRLSPEVDKPSRMKFVEEVMELVELSPLRDALVGMPGVDGLSTEQRKRLTIAVELVANPSIIFMDEPTSGLDARAAAIVMRTVRNTVNTGRTVVCTIHQPSIDIFEAFDELLLMKRGGRVIYTGPLGRLSHKLIEYFEAIPGVPRITDGYNPATWALEVTSVAVEDNLGVDFADMYSQSALFKQNDALIKELSVPAPDAKDLSFPTKFAQPFWVQCLACLQKQTWSYWKNPQYVVVRFFYTTLVALVFGSIFWNLGKKREKQQDLVNLMGSMYCAVLFLGVSNSSSAQPVVAVERTVFYREKAAGMYSPLPYAIAQVAIEVPYVLMQSVVYVAIVYAMVQFEWTAVKFFWFLFYYYFTFLYFTYFGMTTVAITPNYNVAAIIASAFYSTWNLFCGFIIPRPKMPIWWRWMYWGTPVSWTLYGLVASQLGDIDSSLETTEGTVTVKAFLKSYLGMRHNFLGYVALVMALLPSMFALLFALSIKYLNFQKR
eukprot:TRINITY_DN10929_c0_g1_i1.p1 TRINITY_DN10929_c0_g1~~TRINITY_DN10929_c0_g1_i1.p1  ORF type:complete len:1465 (-),score=160.32 TRINITY_DN10929_c0_g1_i1:229-4623(-)